MITSCPASVRPSVQLSVCPFHIFIFFSRTTGPISIKLGTKYSWMKGIQVCSIEGPRPSQRGDNWERIKINWQLLKMLFSRTTGPISTTLGTKRGIQVCSNEGPHPYQRGDNWEIIKIIWQLLKIFFSRTTGPISTILISRHDISFKLGTKHVWVMGIQVCSNEGPRPFPRGDNYKIAKIHWQN